MTHLRDRHRPDADGIVGFPFITLLDGDGKITPGGRVSASPTKSSSQSMTT